MRQLADGLQKHLHTCAAKQEPNLCTVTRELQLFCSTSKVLSNEGRAKLASVVVATADGISVALLFY